MCSNFFMSLYLYFLTSLFLNISLSNQMKLYIILNQKFKGNLYINYLLKMGKGWGELLNGQLLESLCVMPFTPDMLPKFFNNKSIFFQFCFSIICQTGCCFFQRFTILFILMFLQRFAKVNFWQYSLRYFKPSIKSCSKINTLSSIRFLLPRNYQIKERI